VVELPAILSMLWSWDWADRANRVRRLCLGARHRVRKPRLSFPRTPFLDSFRAADNKLQTLAAM